MCLPKWIAAHLDYNKSYDDKLKALNKEGNERLATYIYLVNSDQNEHGNIFK